MHKGPMTKTRGSKVDKPDKTKSHYVCQVAGNRLTKTSLYQLLCIKRVSYCQVWLSSRGKKRFAKYLTFYAKYLTSYKTHLSTEQQSVTHNSSQICCSILTQLLNNIFSIFIFFMWSMFYTLYNASLCKTQRLYNRGRRLKAC